MFIYYFERERGGGGRERMQGRDKERRRERISSIPWHDMSQNQESDSQLTEPPRRPSHSKFLYWIHFLFFLLFFSLCHPLSSCPIIYPFFHQTLMSWFNEYFVHHSKRKCNSLIHIWNLTFLFFCCLMASHSLPACPGLSFLGIYPHCALCIFR